MVNRLTLRTIRQRLDEQAMDYTILMLQNGFSLLCTKRGGRIYGPFESEDSESIFWVNKAFCDSASFSAFLQDEDWNMGGDRLWTAPELAFFVKDRESGFDSFIVQKQLDPGSYDLRKMGGTVILEQNTLLDAYQRKVSHKKFHLKRTISKTDNPLRNLSIFEDLNNPASKNHIKFCGFEQIIEIEDKSSDSDLYLENWMLTQVNTPGRLLVPYTGMMEYADYFEPIDETLYKIHKNYMELQVTGDRRYKVGFKAAVTTGRSGYMVVMSDGRCYLLIRSFLNNPSARYCCEPYDKPGQTGCSLFVYNDSGDLGGYAEIENSGITISGDTGKKSSADTVSYWLYMGEETILNSVADILLGTDLYHIS